METRIYSFPFWLMTYSKSIPGLEMIESDALKLRVYPPFRSGTEGWAPMPAINCATLPFLSGRRPRRFPATGYLKSAAMMPIMRIKGIQEECGLVWQIDGVSNSDQLTLPMNSLRIDILTANDGSSDTDRGDEFVRLFLDNLRVLSSQWWITRSVDPIMGWARHGGEIDEYGTPREDFLWLGKARTTSDKEKVITARMWSEALNLAIRGQKPSLHWELYLDACYFQAAGDYRRMVLDAATACEHAKELVFEYAWRHEHSASYKRGRVLQGYALDCHIDKDLNKLIGRSYKTEQPDNYAVIEDLWDARGNVGHGNDAFYRSDGAIVAVGRDNSNRITAGTLACLKWLDAILHQFG